MEIETEIETEQEKKSEYDGKKISKIKTTKTARKKKSSFSPIFFLFFFYFVCFCYFASKNTKKKKKKKTAKKKRCQCISLLRSTKTKSVNRSYGSQRKARNHISNVYIWSVICVSVYVCFYSLICCFYLFLFKSSLPPTNQPTSQPNQITNVVVSNHYSLLLYHHRHHHHLHPILASSLTDCPLLYPLPPLFNNYPFSSFSSIICSVV